MRKRSRGIWFDVYRRQTNLTDKAGVQPLPYPRKAYQWRFYKGDKAFAGILIRHKDKKTKGGQGHSGDDKTPVITLLQDDGKVVAQKSKGRYN